jgi:hypothetical protein
VKLYIYTYVYTFSHPSVTSHIIGLNSLLAGRLIGMEEKTKAYEILLRDPKRKNSLVDSDIWEDSIKINIKGEECDDLDWIHLA